MQPFIFCLYNCLAIMSNIKKKFVYNKKVGKIIYICEVI